MTEADIWDWQCKMHLWSCYLYEVEADAPLDDQGYDQLCQQLLRSYAKLPDWFTQRVTEGDLTSGSGAAIARSLAPDEIAAARWWRDEHIPAMHKEANDRHRRMLDEQRERDAARAPARKAGGRKGRKKGPQGGREGEAEGARG
jgi:hypothetical protein